MNESGKESRESNRQKLTQETNQNTQFIVRKRIARKRIVGKNCKKELAFFVLFLFLDLKNQ